MKFNVKDPIERIDLSGFMTGFVVANDDNNELAGVVIPKLMPHLPLGEKSIFYTQDPFYHLDDSIIINNSDTEIEFDTVIFEQNFAWINPMEWVRDFTHIHDEHPSFGRIGHPHPNTKEGGVHRNMHTENKRQIANHFSNTQPTVNEEILCMALDEDPQKLYWLPFAPALRGR